jgi:hypothetical protein
MRLFENVRLKSSFLTDLASYLSFGLFFSAFHLYRFFDKCVYLSGIQMSHMQDGGRVFQIDIFLEVLWHVGQVFQGAKIQPQTNREATEQANRTYCDLRMQR